MLLLVQIMTPRQHKNEPAPGSRVAARFFAGLCIQDRSASGLLFVFGKGIRYLDPVGFGIADAYGQHG
ncbi:hypothetical protein K0U00_46635, partial [Paenibacillus sepulcri]|nr:hypothetical protein [Paenibacillus sepulcri]